jgi:ATP-dependent protease ClpP protease subunit
MNNKQGVFLRSMAAESTDATIDIVGVIGWEVAYQQLRDILRSIPQTVKRVAVDIYSPGGDVWEGNGIIQEIGELGKRAETVARVQVAASMATLIAVACQKRSIAANGRFLIHNAWTATMGDAAAHEKAAQTLRDAEQEAARFYAERTASTPDAMLALMAEERWLMPEETKSLGFVQEIDDPFKPEEFEQVRQEIVAAGKWPKALVELPPMPPPTQENADADITNAGAGDIPPVGAAVPEPAADAPPPPVNVESRDYLAGIEAGRGIAAGEFMPAREELTRRLVAAEAEARKFQGMYDQSAATVTKMEKAHAAAMVQVTEQLRAANDRCAKFLSGSLTFSAEPQGWQEALATCGGDYETAAKRYPELRDKYNRENARRK